METVASGTGHSSWRGPGRPSGGSTLVDTSRPSTAPAPPLLPPFWVSDPREMHRKNPTGSTKATSRGAATHALLNVIPRRYAPPLAFQMERDAGRYSWHFSNMLRQLDSRIHIQACRLYVSKSFSSSPLEALVLNRRGIKICIYFIFVLEDRGYRDRSEVWSLFYSHRIQDTVILKTKVHWVFININRCFVYFFSLLEARKLLSIVLV